MRSPSSEPAVGDLLDAGVRRLVVSVERDHVVFELPDLPEEGQKRVHRSTWRRWAKGARLLDHVVSLEEQRGLFSREGLP